MADALAEKLTEMFARPDDEIDLTEAALLISSHRFPNLDVDCNLNSIAEFGSALASAGDANADAANRVVALNRYFFDELGFGPNSGDYYDPLNSCLNQVIQRRTGIPITLSVLYMDLARYVDLAFNGVCYPGHFLVKCELSDGMIVLDPFAKGQSLSISDLQNRLRVAKGGEVSRAIVAGLLVTATKREILLRMLRNLKLIYLRNGEFENALAILDWIVAAAPGMATEVRDRAYVFEKLDCFGAAVSDFERYLEMVPDCDDGDDIRRSVVNLRRSVSLLN